MRQIYQNPDWSPKWEAELQAQFLKDAIQVYSRKTSPIWISDTHIARENKNEVLNWLYKWGRDYQVLAMSFDEFCNQIVERNRPTYPYGSTLYRRYYRRGRRGYLPDNWLDFRVRNHHAHVPKKILSEDELQRREWREHKQFKRDRARRGWSYNCRGNGRKTWAKRFSNRKERRHVRQAILAEKEIKPHRLFQDKWMWD